MSATIDSGLTVQQGRFAALIARGENQTAAYTQAFKCKKMAQKTITENASRLAGNSKVLARVREILLEARIEDVDHANVAFNDLLRHLELAEKAENWTAVAAFDRLRLQHHGMLKADVQVDSGVERDRELIEAIAGADPKKRAALELLMGKAEVFGPPPKLVVDNDGKA